MSLDVSGTFDETTEPARQPVASPHTPTPDAPAPHTPDPRYPVGRAPKLAAGEMPAADDLAFAIKTLADLPEQLRNAVEGLDERQLATPYRRDGWTLRQVVHHVADSHMNALSRFKLGLTEEWPTIYAYDEAAWANLPDCAAPVEWSLEIVEAVHARWGMLLTTMTDAAWQRGFLHPERGRMTLAANTLLYAWHGRHHVAHITHLRAAEGW